MFLQLLESTQFIHSNDSFSKRGANSLIIMAKVNKLRIKLFRHVRKCYRMAGIYPQSEHSRLRRFNAKTAFKLMCMVLCVLFVLSSLLYILFEANSTDEYVKGSFEFFEKLEGVLYFTVNLSKIESILKLIKKFEEFIATSKRLLRLHFQKKKKKSLTLITVLCQIEAHISAYRQLSGKIEKFSTQLYRGMWGLVLFALVIPVICLGFVNYYILHMGADSFEMPAPFL